MASIPSWPNLAKGNTGTNIKALQCLLNYRNNNTALAVDGSFGPSVYNAVVAFQKSKGITANGIAGKDTLSRLVAVVQNGNRNEAVRGAQHLLSKFESLTIDGSFGPSCLTAVKNFQKKMEISVDGSVGPTTWQYLFGYDKYPGGGSTGGTSHIIKMPSGRRCCWNQRYLEIVNTIGSKSGCTITTALDLVNFYGPSNYSIANIKGAWISGQGTRRLLPVCRRAAMMLLALLVRLSTMVSRMPSIFSDGLICRRTLATDPNNSFKPLVDR